MDRVWLEDYVGRDGHYCHLLYFWDGGLEVEMEIIYGMDIGGVYARLGEISEWVGRWHSGQDTHYTSYGIMEEQIDVRFRSMGVRYIGVDWLEE